MLTDRLGEIRTKIQAQFYELFTKALVLDFGIEQESVKDFEEWCKINILDVDNALENTRLEGTTPGCQFSILQVKIIRLAVNFYEMNRKEQILKRIKRLENLLADITNG